MRATLARIILLCVVFLVPGCERPAPAPVSEGEPRIVALSPGLAETVAALGLGDAIVGRHAFDEFTPGSVPAVGDQAGIDYETLLRVEPTQVLLETSAQGVPPRLTELASARGFEVRSFPMLSIEDIRTTVRALPNALNAPASDDEAGRLLASIHDALTPSEPLAARTGRVLPLYWTGPPGAAGPGSYHAEIILALGGQLALDSGAAYQQLDIEDLRRVDPDSIVLFVPGADPARIDDLLEPLRPADLRAVREGRVALVNHPRCQTPGPSVVDTARQLRDAVASWPQSFGD